MKCIVGYAALSVMCMCVPGISCKISAKTADTQWLLLTYNPLTFATAN